MAGTNSGFNATLVRDKLHFAMQMGMPNTVADRPTFRWIVQPEFAPNPVSPSGDPYSWTETENPTGPQPITDLQVLCAVQYGTDAPEGTVAGFEQALHATITILDVDYALLIKHGGRPPDQILIAQDIYNMDYIEPEVGLFNMDVYTLHATAQDQP
jgi:hypothetical protein